MSNHGALIQRIDELITSDLLPAPLIAVLEAAKAALFTQARTIADLTAAVELLRSALPDSKTAGPEGDGYAYAWDELNGDEQEWVKAVRAKVLALEGK